MDVYSSKYGDNMFWRPSCVWNRAVGSRQLSALSSILGYAAQPDTMTPGPFRGSPRLDVDSIIKYGDILGICYGDTSWEKNRWYMMIPVVPARGGAEVALKIYMRPFSSIELACAVRQPSPCVRAHCESCVLLHMSHLKPHVTLHTWQSSHFTLHPSQSTLHTSQFTLRSPQSTLHTPHFTLHSPHFTLLTSHFTLHTSHCTLHAPHFTLHSSHSTLHLIWALLTLSQLISSHLISSHMSPKISWITSQYYY